MLRSFTIITNIVSILTSFQTQRKQVSSRVGGKGNEVKTRETQ